MTKLNQGLLALSLFGLSTSLFAAIPEPPPTIISGPHTPICMGKSCPYVIEKSPYSVKIHCESSTANDDGYTCLLYASNGKLSVQKNIADQLDSDPTYYWVTPTLLEIKDVYEHDLTSYFANRAIFVDFQTMQISPVFFSVYAINLNKMVVLADSSIEQDQTPNETIFIMPMFDPSQFITIDRNFGGYYDHTIYSEPSSRFLSNGNLQLVYMTSEHRVITEVIPVDYSKFSGLKTN